MELTQASNLLAEIRLLPSEIQARAQTIMLCSELAHSRAAETVHHPAELNLSSQQRKRTRTDKR